MLGVDLDAEEVDGHADLAVRAGERAARWGSRLQGGGSGGAGAVDEAYATFAELAFLGRELLVSARVRRLIQKELGLQGGDVVPSSLLEEGVGRTFLSDDSLEGAFLRGGLVS